MYINGAVGLFLPHILIETIEWNLELLQIASDVGVICERALDVFITISTKNVTSCDDVVYCQLWSILPLFAASDLHKSDFTYDYNQYQRSLARAQVR